MIRASLRYLYCSDADPFEDYKPQGPFGISFMALVGPADGPGEESFQFTICTPDWFSEQFLCRSKSIASGRHFLFTTEFDYAALESFIREYCAACEGETWREVAEKLARLGWWEFEDYQTFPIEHPSP